MDTRTGEIKEAIQNITMAIRVGTITADIVTKEFNSITVKPE
jgi:hypothetical protein